jgi:ankyrin repeat protein
VLWWAVHNSNFELVKKLLEGGGNPNARDQEESSCMHEAMKNGDIEIIFILLDYGADLNNKNNRKQTPLYFCNSKMLQLLGLEDGLSTGEGNPHSDNNRLFYRPEASDIYL